MRNSADPGTAAAALRRLAERLPPSWRISQKPCPRHRRVRLCAPAGEQLQLDVFVRQRLEPKDALALIGQAGGLEGKLVLAPFLGRRTRLLLAEAGASYADASGNLRVVLDSPGLFVEAPGAPKDPARRPRPLLSLQGPAAARVVRGLCDLLPPYGVRELARRAGTAPASVSRVLARLELEALVERGERDEVVAVEWPGVLERWAEDYRFPSGHDARTFDEPDGALGVLEKLRGYRARAAVTGALAAERHGPPRSPGPAAETNEATPATVYLDDPTNAAKALGFRPAGRGGNLVLARPFDPVVYERTWVKERVRYAAPSQAAADLLGSSGHGPSEGAALVAWMKQHPTEWRA